MTRQNWRQFDWILLGAIVVLSIYGIFMISSAVKGDPELSAYPERQITYLLIGIGLMFAVAAFDYHFLSTLTVPFYVIVLGILALVGILGTTLFGAQSWINFFGLFPIQPSELAKVALVLALGRFLANHQESMGRPLTMVQGILITAPLLILVFVEPDLGTAVVIAVEVAILFVAAGLPLRYMLATSAIGLAALPLFWTLLADHQRTRLLIFLDPTSDPNSYFNVDQALVGVGSGGLLGKGFGEGTQSQLHFLRVRHTDFIFAVTAEEMGFIGAVLMIGLLLFILMRLWRIAAQARDPFGKLLVTGVAAIVLFQTVINVGMNMALVPVTGLPLPFVSYGGNAMLSLFLLMGLAQSVAMRKRKIEFQAR